MKPMEKSVCKTCKKCCVGDANTYFSKREYENIRTMVTEAKEENGLMLVPYKNGKCQLLGENGCIATELRPISCKMYPFRPDQRKGWVLCLNCPYWRKFTEKDWQKAKEIMEAQKDDYRDK